MINMKKSKSKINIPEFGEIKQIKAIRVLDSRGIPTIRTFVFSGNAVASASVPSGTSDGLKEAIELRDKDKMYFGLDVKKAIENVNTKINKALKGMFIFDQRAIDNKLIELDGTENKSNLGANAILSTSLAVARLAALELNIPLYKYIGRLNKNNKHIMPIPILNIINGGAHAGDALPFQEFQIIPHFNNLEKNVQASVEIYHKLKEKLLEKYGLNATNVGYEGGFAPDISDSRLAIALISDAIAKTGYAKDVTIGLDCAANGFYNSKKKTYLINKKEYDKDLLINYYLALMKEFKITSIEDPFSENDKEAWVDFYYLTRKKINLIGDDLLVTNPKIIKEAISKNYCNSLILKPNQIGTLSESIDAFNLAKKAGWKVIVSHRSGETEDTFITDLAVGLGADYVKFGAPARGERTCKYNRLLEIDRLHI